MSREKEFDQTFKERINQMDFEFKESYWNEMEALLDNKKKKRGALFWWISSLSVASMLIAGALFLIPGKTNDTAKNALEQTNRVEQDQLPEMPEISGEQAAIMAIETSSKTEDSSEKEQHESQHNHSALQTVNAPLKNRGSASGQNPTHQLPENTQSASLGVDNNKATPSAGIEAHKDAEPAQNVENKDTKSIVNNVSTQQNLAAVHENAASQIQKLPLKAMVIFPSSHESQLAPLGEEPIVHNRTWDSHVGILAGTNFGQSFNTASGAVGGLGSHLGLRFYFAHKKGLQLNTGLSFGVNSINGLKYEEHRKVFGFTQYDLVNTIHYQSMLTAHVPLYVGYESARFSVAGGLRLNYIMNTKGRVYTWDNSYYDQNIWGYAHGIKYFNMACGLESSYRLARRWDAGVSLDVDLSSRSEENNNLISPEARLWQAGIFIKYRLN